MNRYFKSLMLFRKIELLEGYPCRTGKCSAQIIDETQQTHIPLSHENF